MAKENIRKVVQKKRKESKIKYKKLQGLAIDSNYNDSLKIREQENAEWNKFKFFSGLMIALDKKEN